MSFITENWFPICPKKIIPSFVDVPVMHILQFNIKIRWNSTTSRNVMCPKWQPHRIRFATSEIRKNRRIHCNRTTIQHEKANFVRTFRMLSHKPQYVTEFHSPWCWKSTQFLPCRTLIWWICVILAHLDEWSHNRLVRRWQESRLSKIRHTLGRNLQSEMRASDDIDTLTIVTRVLIGNHRSLRPWTTLQSWSETNQIQFDTDDQCSWTTNDECRDRIADIIRDGNCFPWLEPMHVFEYDSFCRLAYRYVRWMQMPCEI
jgi:hypothetical protein